MAAASNVSRRVVVYSLLSGLGEIFPIPFVDDWLRNLFRRRLVRGMLQRHGLRPSGSDVRILAQGLPTPLFGRGVWGCLVTAVVWPLEKVAWKLVKKLFRKILFVFTLKDGADAVSRTFHEAHLLRYALDHGHLGPGQLGPGAGSAAAIRVAVDEALDAVDTRPVERTLRQTLHGGRRLLGHGLSLLAWARRDSAPDSTSTGAGTPLSAHDDGLVEGVRAHLEGETPYLRALEGRFVDALRRPRPDAPAARDGASAGSQSRD